MTHFERSLPRPEKATELQATMELERAGDPFLVLRDAASKLVLFPLGAGRGPILIGRAAASGLALEWDMEASRAHAELSWVGDAVVISDGGLSQNGTFVNGERVTDRRRLRDGDLIGIGGTQAVFRDPREADQSETHRVSGEAPSLTDAQRRVLEALARPWLAGRAAPATNPEIAAELVISVNTVKTHMRALVEAFDLPDGPPHLKRAQIVTTAFQAGLLPRRAG